MKEERPTPLVEDIEGTRRKLESWFSQRLGSAVSIDALKIPEATGMSNVTLLFNISYQKDGKAHSEACVGRLVPPIKKPVFPSYDLSLQYRVMETLGTRTPVKAPPLLGLETDTTLLGSPFFIMKKVDGRIPGDMPPYTMGGWLMEQATPAQRETLWNEGIREMAKIHRLDYRALGFEFLEQPKYGDTALQQQLSYWERYAEWGMEGHPHPIHKEALQWLRDNQPKNEPTTLCWGDARIGNMIFADDCSGATAVLDWEMVTIGNPLQDVVWWNYIDRFFADGLGMPRLEGLPSYADTIKLWERETGFSGADYRYYEIFAGMRYALILSRIMVASGQVDQVANNISVALLEKVLAE